MQGTYPQAPHLHYVDGRMSSEDTVRAANLLAFRHSADAPVRRVAASVVKGMRDVPRQAPDALAAWVRSNLLYTQESPGIEALNGANTTLWTGTGDCDDLATTWATLVRSVGVEAFVVGLQRPGRRGFFHAVGLANGQLYELSRDETYGAPMRGRRIVSLPPGVVGFYYDPWKRRDGRVSDAMGSARDAWAGTQDLLSELGIELDPGMLPNGRIGDAVKFVAATAGSAAATGSTVAALAATTSLNAIPGVGQIAAAVAAIGMFGAALARRNKQRRRAARRGNEVKELGDVVAALCQIDPEKRIQFRLWWAQLLPRMVGSYGAKGYRSRRVTIATVDNMTADDGLVWLDGSTGRKLGVQEVFYRKSNGARLAAEAMTGHRDAALAMARALARIPLSQRRETVALAFGAFIPQAEGDTAAAMRYLGLPMPAAAARIRQRRSSARHAWMLALPAAAVGALLLSRT